MTKTIGVIVGILILVGGIYWLISTTNSSSQGANSTGQNATTTTTARDIPVLTYVTSTTTGNRITATGNGMTLYTFKNDSYNTSACIDVCAQTWIPYTIPEKGNLTATGLAGIISTITRPDGTLQVTLNGLPLYFYKNDLKPGDTKGKNVNSSWEVAIPADQTGS